MARGKSSSWSIRGQSDLLVPNLPTTWDKFLESEGLVGQEGFYNRKIREFVEKNFHLVFIPISVLEMYGKNYDE